jgi:hypothetical protein
MLMTPARTTIAVVWSLVVLAGAPPTPASAAPMKQVLDACARTAGCQWDMHAGGEIVGCSPHACFSCDSNTKKCVRGPAPSSVKRQPTGTTRTGVGATAGNTSVVSNSANTKPINNVGNIGSRMPGRH